MYFIQLNTYVEGAMVLFVMNFDCYTIAVRLPLTTIHLASEWTFARLYLISRIFYIKRFRAYLNSRIFQKNSLLSFAIITWYTILLFQTNWTQNLLFSQQNARFKQVAKTNNNIE